MADEFVTTAQFGEFVKRIDERFDHVQKDVATGFAHVNQLADQRYENVNQRLADAEKAREENLVYVNQRFDAMNHRFDDMNRSMNQRFDEVNRRFVWMMLLFSPMMIAILGLVGALVQLAFTKS